MNAGNQELFKECWRRHQWHS